MRRYVFLLFIGCFLTSCSSGQIKAKKDEFTGKTVITVDYDGIDSLEKGVFSNYSANFQFVREFDSKNESSYCDVKIFAGQNSKDLELKCFVKIDDKTFDLSAGDRKTVNVTEVTTTTTHKQQADGFVDFTKGEKNTEVTGSHKELSARIAFPKEFKSSVLAGKKVIIRLYSGTDSATFDLGDEWVANLKQFFAHTGKE